MIVSVLAYAGLRPGELRALRWADVRERTLLIQRAAAPDGAIKSTKNAQARTVRLLRPLAADLLGHSLAVLIDTYAHLIDEYEEADRVDPEAEIGRGREIECTTGVRWASG